MADARQLDVNALRQWADGLGARFCFLTVSGAHLYGFPSRDSDVDLRGCHVWSWRQAARLDSPDETLERHAHVQSVETELVSHEAAKYLSLLLKNNGYILEQIFSPLVIQGEEFLAQLRPLAQRCITRHHYHHYRGFIATQRKLLDKQDPKGVKPLLYAYRVLLTGIHLLRTGKVESNLPTLNRSFGLQYIDELIALKQTELADAPRLDWAFHAGELTRLEAELDRAFAESTLPEDRDREPANELLVELRRQAFVRGDA